MRKIIALMALALTLLAVVLGARTLRFSSRQPRLGDSAEALPSPAAAAERLAASIRIETVSRQQPAVTDPRPFLELHEFLAGAYPRTHAELERETVADLSLLYTWRGSEPRLAPLVLMAHLDVVPVVPGTEGDWLHPPFSGALAEGFVWGRGALDDKASLIALLEAVETLVAEGFRPRRTLLVALGHDEETGGEAGAGRIAELLVERYGELAMVLDEGGLIADELAGSNSRPVALVGIAEKGYLSLELRVAGAGGHSSMPPASTAVGILAAAVSRIERAPFPARIDGATREMLAFLGPELPFARKLLMANLWLFEPLVRRIMVGDYTTAAMVRTTTAPTMLAAGIKDNVLPASARAVINFRILPGDSVASVSERVRELVDDPRVAIEPLASRHEPSPVSDPDSAAFRLLASTVRRVDDDPELLVAPYLVVAGTDAKYYSGRSPNVFRFLPVRIAQEDLARIHGTNERVSLADLARSIAFYRLLVSGADNADL